MKLILKLLFIGITFVSCRDNEQVIIEKSEYIKIAKDKKKINELWKRAINKGDIAAYNEVSNIYFLQNDLTELYYFSFLMANKHSCSEAFYNLYEIINSNLTIDGIYLNSNDANSINTSYYYLLKSYELDSSIAKIRVLEVFGKNKKIPSSRDFLKKIH